MAARLAQVVRQFAHLGEWVERGADVAVLQGPAPAMVHTYLPPDQARYAQVGRLATLRFMDGGRIRAEVVDVVAEAERTPAERTSPLTPRMPSIVARLRTTMDLQPGTVFLPFHFAESPANALTSHEHLDPTVKIPALKLTPVRVEEAK